MGSQLLGRVAYLFKLYYSLGDVKPMKALTWGLFIPVPIPVRNDA